MPLLTSIDLSAETLTRLRRDDAVREAASVLEQSYGELAPTEAQDRIARCEAAESWAEREFWLDTHQELLKRRDHDVAERS